MRKNKVVSVICIVLCVVGLIAFMGSGLVEMILLFARGKDFTNNPDAIQKGDFAKATIYSGTQGPIYEISHTESGIPVGTEYYYVVWANDEMILVRAGKLFGKKFALNGYNPYGVKLFGKIKKMDSAMEIDMNRLAKEMQEYGYTSNSLAIRHVYFDNLLIPQAMLRLIVGFLIFGGVALMLTNGKDVPMQDYTQGMKVKAGIGFGLLLAGLLLGLYTTTFLF